MIKNFENGGKILRLMADGNQDVFRYGLQKYSGSEYEDPTYIGFTIEIDSESALFTEVLPFLEKYGSTRNEIQSRIPVYKEFIDKVQTIFKSQESIENDSDKSRFIKSHYINSISGLNNLTKKFNVWKEDMLTIQLHEDISMYTSYLAYLYNNLTYSYENGRELIPENLLKFNMYIKMSEIRNLTNIRKISSNDPQDQFIANALKNNVTSITYKLFDCQFDFMKSKPFDDEVAINGIDAQTPGDSFIELDLYFKSVSRQIYNPLVDGSVSMNDNKIDLDVLIVNKSGNASPSGQNIDNNGNLIGPNGERFQKQQVDSESSYNQEAFLNDTRNASSTRTLNIEDGAINKNDLEEKVKILQKLKAFNAEYNILSLINNINNDIQGLADPDNVIGNPLGELTEQLRETATNTVAFEKGRLLREIKRKRNELVRLFLHDIRENVGINRISPENVNVETNTIQISLERLRNNLGNIVFDEVINNITGN